MPNPAELPSNICGRRVTGVDFFGRERDVARTWSRLETDHLLLSAPRRVGKTSLMQQLLQEAPGRKWQAVYLSAEDAKDEAHFVSLLFSHLARNPELGEIAAALHQHKWGERFKSLAKLSVSVVALELRQAATGSWTELAAVLEGALFGLSPGRKVLIMVDELPVFLLRLRALSPQRAEDFLHWFRHLRQGPAGRSDELRWLLAGSIGLAPLARREGWSAHINDLLPLSLGAYTDEVAMDFLGRLSSNYKLGLEEAERRAILDRLGWPIPFFIHLFVKELREQLEDGRRGAAAQEAAWEALLGSEAAKHFSPWWERLDKELGPTEASAARALLSAAAAEEGATRLHLEAAMAGHFNEVERDERRVWLLDVLENDGYLIQVNGEVDGRWRFRSPLLRASWLRRSRR